MNYVATAQRPNPAAMLGALGIPGAFAALLVVGLAVTVVPKEEDGPLILVPTTPDIPDTPPPPPKPDDPKPDTSEQQNQTPEFIPAPLPPIDIGQRLPIEVGPLPPIDEELFIGPVEVSGGGLGIEPPAPPLPDPIAASPRNAPGGWITDRDYKTRWIREGREGVARFNLEISASGRVSNCTVTGTTGHNVLDVATCRLITRRARFQPAKDSTGAKVPGTFSSSVNWQIPE